jgi:hypothetical protein
VPEDELLVLPELPPEEPPPSVPASVPAPPPLDEEHAPTNAVTASRRWLVFTTTSLCCALFWIQKNSANGNGETRAVARRLEQTLAARLRELAKERGMPISHVADRCGMAHSYFWQILTARASASLSVVQRLAEALDVDPLVLLGGDLEWGGKRAAEGPSRLRSPRRSTSSTTKRARR